MPSCQAQGLRKGRGEVVPNGLYDLMLDPPMLLDLDASERIVALLRRTLMPLPRQTPNIPDVFDCKEPVELLE